MDLKRRKYEQAVAAEIAHELHRALGPSSPEALIMAENRELVCEVFGRVFDRHQVVTEDAGARILGYVPKVLAGMNQSFAELNRRLDAAMRQPLTRN